jgi:hypothetical protein
MRSTRVANRGNDRTERDGCLIARADLDARRGLKSVDGAASTVDGESSIAPGGQRRGGRAAAGFTREGLPAARGRLRTHGGSTSELGEDRQDCR